MCPNGPGIANRARRRVLLVDDETEILESLQQLIESTMDDVDVVLARSADEGLQVMKTGRVDLVVSDYCMPDTDGIAFMEQAQQIAPGVPRILITGYPDLQLATRAINDAGIVKLLSKPFDAEEFLRAVRNCLHQRLRESNRSAAFAAALAHRRPKDTEGES